MPPYTTGMRTRACDVFDKLTCIDKFLKKRRKMAFKWTRKLLPYIYKLVGKSSIRRFLRMHLVLKSMNHVRWRPRQSCLCCKSYHRRWLISNRVLGRLGLETSEITQLSTEEERKTKEVAEMRVNQEVEMAG